MAMLGISTYIYAEVEGLVTRVMLLSHFPQQLTYDTPEETTWNFACNCGAGFHFEDDLQVHRVCMEV